MKKYLLLLLLIATSALAAPTVVLPERFKNQDVIVVNTPAFDALVAKNEALKKQLAQEAAAKTAIQNEVNNQKKVNDQNQQKLIDDYNKSQLEISKKNTTIAKQATHIVLLYVGIALGLAAFVAALWFKILRFGIGF